MPRLRSVLFVVTAALVGIAACANDFDKFDSADGRGADPLAEQDASGDGATQGTDGSTPRGDGGPSLDAGDAAACLKAAPCVAAMTTCRSSCTQAQAKCTDDCNNNKCRMDCRDAFDDCNADCRTTCRSCAGACPKACD